MNLEDFIKDLSPELQEKARACGSVEELVALAKDAKIPVPDEALAAIAGGDDQEVGSCGDSKCPKCKSKNTTIYKEDDEPGYVVFYWRCNSCGNEWKEYSLDG